MEVHPEVAEAFALSDRVAVITGAGSGIGQEAARLFALAGARIVAADMNADALADTLAMVRKAGGDAVIRCIDVSRHAEVESLADAAIAEFGALDVWVNCAGMPYLHSILETDPAQAERVVAVNMMGPYWGCAAAARVMRERGGGAIINVSSGGGFKPTPGMAAYGMTKAAVNSLTWTAATEFGAYGIRVNGIAPGFVETPMTNQLYTDATGKVDQAKRAEVLAGMARNTRLGRAGNVTDIAYALLYLAADASSFVTGQILRVNGGESM